MAKWQTTTSNNHITSMNTPRKKKSPNNSQESPTKLELRLCKTLKHHRLTPHNVSNTHNNTPDIQPDNIISTAVDIHPDNIISTGVLDGSNDRPVKVKNIASKIASKVCNEKNRQQKKISDLLMADAEMFSYELMLAVYQKSGEKIEMEQIPEDETLYGYLTNKGVISTEFVGPNKSEVIAIILPWCWYDGLRTRTQWDDKKERDYKREMNQSTGSHAKSLRLVLNQNMKEAHRDQNMMAEYYSNKFITYGDYEDRPSAFPIKFEVKDTSVIADYLVPGFINCTSYRYDVEDNKPMPHRLFWNGERVNTANLKYVRLMDVQGKYVIIDVAKNKEDKQLVIDTTGLRGERVAFYRVGDFLTLNEIDCIIRTCETYQHAIPTFVLICVKYRHHQLLKNYQQLQLEKKKKKKEIDEADGIVQVATEFIQALRVVLCENYRMFSIAEFVRLSWVTWSSFDARYDKMFTESGSKWRKNARRRATRHVVDRGTKEKMCEDIRQLDYTIILSITQQGTDESILRMFQCISYKFDSLQSYLKPLEKMSFDEYFEVMVEICRPSCGMYVTRALTMLSIFVVSAILFEGKVPTESIDILSFWQVHEKKSNLIRNCVSGVYDGVGCDAHVIKFLGACAALKSAMGLSTEDVYLLGKKIPKDPGAYLNELVGECGQSYNARKDESDLRWGKWKSLLKKVSSQREDFKKIIDVWLPDWDNEVDVLHLQSIR